MHMQMNPGPQPPRPTRGSRTLGRIIVTVTLVGGLAGGWWALTVGKRLAEERKARVKSPATAPAR